MLTKQQTISFIIVAYSLPTVYLLKQFHWLHIIIKFKFASVGRFALFIALFSPDYENNHARANLLLLEPNYEFFSTVLL